MKKIPNLLLVLVLLTVSIGLDTDLSVASDDLCVIQEGKVICTADQKVYDSKRICLRRCVPGQSGVSPPAIPPRQPVPGSCIDADGDLHGRNCNAGPDCNDSERLLTDNCNVCGNRVAEASNSEECDWGNDNGKWVVETSGKCSDGTNAYVQWKCHNNCKLERFTPQCSTGTTTPPSTEPGRVECLISGGNAICSSGNPQREFNSRRLCLRRCVPGQVPAGTDGDSGGEKKPDLRVPYSASSEYPDLQVTLIPPETAVLYDHYNVTVRVSNTGGRRADRTFRTFVIFGRDRATHGEQGARNMVVHWLDPGRAVEQKFERYSTTLGSLEYEAHVDADNVIDEINEKNNDATAQMTILEFGALLTTQQAVLVPYQDNRFRVSAVIKNEGNTRLSRQARVTALINQSFGNSQKTVCSGEGFMKIALQPGKSARSVIYLKKTGSQQSCVLQKGDYTLSLFVGADRFVKHFGFGADPANPALVCPALDDVTPYGFAAKPVGFRSVIDLYCDLNGVLSPQKNVKSPCVNSFECKTNLCAAGICVNEARLNDALSKIS